ncbi:MULTISPECIES: hypothetical protein [unclassified Paenibacillus]|uniref:hypothetical protein n=1 Tax=unclassified Paenibacillus TaxID=185978 RepID=UPI0009556B3A|nr:MULTISPECIES: hypothetical protein [unclassified Paenibacillus]ASS65095.1 hypothetical protein CIC07_02410 [Paenibacillus sp. RUD330]SIQ48670.1 hypothetical protein SAMN05880555_1886 [Paenibacillus sp. RU4X]SIQ70571.1 hypothetical protein SAMN05880570_1884 [Paenibacillus sp. RU4T]
MDKHLSRYQMLFSLGFIFMLVAAVGAFFAGVEVGSSRTESRYEAKKLLASAASAKTSYSQQDLVSFYHTVFSPYREFQNEWLAMEKKVESRNIPASSSLLKDLGDLADEKRKEIESVRSVPDTGLLASARIGYLASLDSISQASAAAAKVASGQPADSFLSSLRKQQSYKDAARKGLAAQKDYYSSMLKWASGVDGGIPSEAVLTGTVQSSAWSSYPLLVKIKLMADLLEKRGRWTDYYPQDLAGSVDALLQSGESQRLHASSINELADVVTGTGAVRGGDFWTMKSRLYGKETLPQLPFFLPPDN